MVTELKTLPMSGRSVPVSTSGLRSPSRWTYGQPHGFSAVFGWEGHQYGAWLR